MQLPLPMTLNNHDATTRGNDGGDDDGDDDGDGTLSSLSSLSSIHGGGGQSGF